MTVIPEAIPPSVLPTPKTCSEVKHLLSEGQLYQPKMKFRKTDEIKCFADTAENQGFGREFPIQIPEKTHTKLVANVKSMKNQNIR